MTTRRTCLPVPVPGSRLPATSSGHRIGRPVDPGHRFGQRPAATGPGHRLPATGLTGHRQTASEAGTGQRLPASGGKPNPAIPLEAARPALPHVRPRGRFWRTLVSDVASFWRALVSGEPLRPWTSCTAGGLGKHGGMARFWLALCALYGNVLGTESVICWH